MATQNFFVDKLDPNLYTGMARMMSGPVRSGNVTVDVPYGTNGESEYADWLYVGTTGNISYVKWDGNTQVLTNVAAGRWHNIASKMINSSGTTASGLVWGS